MACHGYEALLKEAALGAAPVPELEAHLRTCQGCARRLWDDRRLVTALTTSLEAAMDVEPSAAFLTRVRQRVVDERAQASARRARWLPGLAACAALTLALIVALQPRLPTFEHAQSSPSASGRIEAVVPPRVAVGRPPTPSEAPPGRQSAVSTRDEAVKVSLVPGGEVLVEPGQVEALARLAAGPFDGLRPRPEFAVASLDPDVPLPRLAPRDLPRFEMKALELRVPEWPPAWEEGSSVLDTNEGSDS
jgi:hypothetical protein